MIREFIKRTYGRPYLQMATECVPHDVNAGLEVWAIGDSPHRDLNDFLRGSRAGSGASALGNWVKHSQPDPTKGRTGLTSAEGEELTRLRRENGTFQEEREILNKAATLFAKHQR
jgi:hypothetical protein